MRRLLPIFVLAATAHAQQSMGTVPTHDALVSGGLEVHGEQARLLTNASITAYDHTAKIALDRGGELLVCSTSQFHLLHSGTSQSLLFGLDRGAIEIHGKSQEQDVILTPDIRFTLEHPGTYDLRLRVTRSGDTCVENAGTTAPVLILSDPFTSQQYRLIPGQHVLFEHGHLGEVVDHERSSCGCPVETPVVLTASATPAQKAAAEHPFPAAASQELAPNTVAVNSTPGGDATAQVSTNITAAGGIVQPSPAPPPPASPPAPASTPVASAQAKTPPGAHDIGNAIVGFFRRLFHGSRNQARKEDTAKP